MQAGAMKMKCMAEGGLVGSIKGMLGMGAKAATSPATPASTPAPQKAISEYAGMTALQRREKAAGLKDGGKVKGPGTGTSDSVPAMLSKGEYVMPADSVKHFGVKTLEAMRKATHTPVKMGAKKGAIRKMANGGRPEDEIPLTTAAPSVAAQPQISSTELGRNISNTLAAIPGAAPALGAIRGLAGASSVLPSASNIVSKVASVAAPVAPYAPVVGGVAALNAGANPPQPAAAPAPVMPTPAAMPSVSTDVQRGGAAQPGTPAAVAASTAPGVRVDGTNAAGKANSFTDGVQPALGARGPISAQNMGAADSLAARYDGSAKAQYDQEVADAAATNAAGGFGTGQPQTARSMILAQLAGKKLSGKGARVLSELDRTDAQTAVATAANKLAQDKLGVEKTVAGADARLKGAQATTAEGVIAAQARLAAAKTPEEVKAATENLRVVQGREHANRYTVIPGGQTVDPATGQPLRDPATVLDNQTGQIVNPGAQAAPKKAAGFEVGKVYKDAKGNTAKWDGSKFVPA